METIMEIQQLKKSFGNQTVVKEISFHIEKGEILCLLGPNGAGKSTTIHMISSLLKQDSGMIRYCGQLIQECQKTFQQKLGVVPQDIALYEDLSAAKNIHFFASLYGMKGAELEKAVQEALALSGLQDRANDRVKTFSGGMKRRLNIACAIAHHPRLVIMDEPTVGIDPQSRNHILDSIRALQKHGMSILYTTHYMEEVEEIASRIIIMDHGAIIAEGTKESLKEALSTQRQFHIELEDITQLEPDVLYEIEGVKKVELIDHTLVIATLKNVENLDLIITELIRQKQKIRNLNCQNASLETVFLELTGRSLRD